MKRSTIFKTLCAVAVMTFTCRTAQAQLEISGFLGGLLPAAAFNDDASNVNPLAPVLGVTNIGKEASVGFSLGARASYRFDIGYGEVAPFANVDFMLNRVSGDYRDAIERLKGDPTSYINIPVLVGVQYSYPLDETFRPFAEFGLGFDMFFVGAEGWKKADDPIAKPYYKYNVNNTFAWEVGAGCFFGKFFSAGLYYYGLGKHAIDYNKKSTPYIQLAENELRTIGNWALRLGFHF
ncbi:MAG: hypothetical protein IJ684_06230 [Bacteroidales bacterium]|nr:hypothetical protein [Bacteroidales bacterium]